MKVVKISPYNPNSQILLEAAQLLKSGGSIIYPTDTAYGLGANAFDNQAVQKIFMDKGREYHKPMHVVVENLAMAKNLAVFDNQSEKLFNRYLPGPLTLVLKKQPIVSDLLTANLPTIGIRLPNNLITRQLSTLSGLPYTATSANVSNEPTPYSITDISPELLNKVDLILDVGQLPKVLPSTVIDFSTKEPKLLRAGPVSFEEILLLLGE